MLKNFIIIGLLCLCVWMGNRIVVLDRYNYASRLNMCSEYANPADLIGRHNCLKKMETRTNWMWHLANGLNIL